MAFTSCFSCLACLPKLWWVIPKQAITLECFGWVHVRRLTMSAFVFHFVSQEPVTQRHFLTMVAPSAELFTPWFPPLLKGADGSPHSTPVGFPPGRANISVTRKCVILRQCGAQESKGIMFSYWLMQYWYPWTIATTKKGPPFDSIPSHASYNLAIATMGNFSNFIFRFISWGRSVKQ